MNGVADSRNNGLIDVEVDWWSPAVISGVIVDGATACNTQQWNAIRIMCAGAMAFPGNQPVIIRNQARFAGVGLARPLAEEIWVVDGGQAWGSGGHFPLQWIALGRAGKAGRGTLHLQVTAYDLDSSESVVLIDAAIEPLPPDEAQGLLAVTGGPAPGVYLLATSVALAKSGCLHLEAVVVQGGATLYTGQAFVQVN